MNNLPWKEITHNVEFTPDGKKGIELFREGKFDMVFTDLGMPGMSGWQVAEQIKKDLSRFQPHIPLLHVLCNRGMKKRHWIKISERSKKIILEEGHKNLPAKKPNGRFGANTHDFDVEFADSPGDQENVDPEASAGLEAGTHQIGPPFEKSHDETKVKERKEQQDESNRIPAPNSETSNRKSDDGVDINQMMSQPSSFRAKGRIGNGKKKTHTSFHEIQIERSDFTPEIYSHELKYADWDPDSSDDDQPNMQSRSSQPGSTSQPGRTAGGRDAGNSAQAVTQKLSAATIASPPRTKKVPPVKTVAKSASTGTSTKHIPTKYATWNPDSDDEEETTTKPTSTALVVSSTTTKKRSTKGKQVSFEEKQVKYELYDPDKEIEIDPEDDAGKMSGKFAHVNKPPKSEHLKNRVVISNIA